MSGPRLLVCSHRGPITYSKRRGRLEGTRGGGGLIGIVGPVVRRFGGTWIASALSPADHELAAQGTRAEDGFDLSFLSLPDEIHRAHYDVVCNEHLWFLFHYLFDVSDEPVFDHKFALAWDGYIAVNDLYARAVASTRGADVLLVEDYHLMRVAAQLREAGEARVPMIYFHHVPWVEPDYFGVLPARVREQILEGLLAFDVVGFHATRWARAFLACCDRFLAGVVVGEDQVSRLGQTTRVIVAPGPADAGAVRAAATSAEAQAWYERHDERRAGRRTLVRVERIDLSKNVLRGLLSFEALLERRPDLANEVWFLALGYVSRPRVARYRRYLDACRATAERINDRFGDSGTRPLDLDVEDDIHRSLAGMRIADVLLVNPVFDGLNMVAKEGPVVNERHGALVLSRNAGAYEELERDVLAVNPFDVLETAEAIERAVEMPMPERRERAKRLRRLVEATTPEGWVRGQLMAAGFTP